LDALSEVLRLSRFSANVTLDATAREPWCISIPVSESMGRAHLVVEGECHLRTATEEVTLRAGELLPVRLGGAGCTTRVISLSFSCERHLAAPLLSSLPRIVFVDLTGAAPLEWLVDSLSLVLSASDAPFQGTTATRSRLAEIVFVEALARYVQALPPDGKGWLAGLNDRYVGRALALVHGRPSEAWTVEKLGRQVRLSRSALAERFSDVIGEPIFAFLTRWRLQLAAEALLTTARTIESIARQAGYESAGAFSHAFKRVFGKPPSVWRKKRRKLRA